jgi:hypothetical protein
LKVSIQPTSDLLTALRANLARIDGLAKEDQTPASLELRALLLRRIAIIDLGPATNRCTVAPKSEPKGRDIMMDHRIPQPVSTETLLASLRGTVQRMEHSENPENFVLIKQLILERIADIEAEAEQEPPADS